MEIKPIQPTTDKYLTFGITTKQPIKKIYAPGCWNEVSEGKYKDYTFTIYNNYQNKIKCSTVIILKKLGEWIKSKLKYRDMYNERRVIWSHRKDRKEI